MTDTRTQLIDEIERFLALSGMNKTRFGLEAAGNDKILDQLKAGANPRIDTVDGIRRYIHDWRPARPKSRAAYQPAA
jgi:hypothetical protein